jgi:hypothetical protein
MKNELSVPGEISDLFYEAYAHDMAFKVFIMMPFGYKKAIKAGKMTHKLKDKAWNMLSNLYPEIKDKKMQYNSIKKTITEVESND